MFPHLLHLGPELAVTAVSRSSRPSGPHQQLETHSLCRDPQTFNDSDMYVSNSAFSNSAHVSSGLASLVPLTLPPFHVPSVA